jgi:type IV pilus assembly protein PilN
MKISLNLASRPFSDLGPALKRLRIGMAVLAVVAIALVFGLRAFDQKAEAARARDHSLDGQIGRVEQERHSYEAMMREPENAQLLVQSSALNKLFDDKAFSWTLAMEDLETVLPGGVQVASLDPTRDKEGHITIHLRVKGPRDKAIGLVSNLEHSKRFLFPRIRGENSDTGTAGPGERLEPVASTNNVNVELEAEYNPMAPVEHRAAEKRKASSNRGGTGNAVPGELNPATHHERPAYTGSDAAPNPKARPGGQR